MAKKRSFRFLVILVVVLIAGGGYFFWRQAGELPVGFASGNGRVEATEVDVAAKQQGRVEAVLVKEGDMVEEGQLLAQMDAAVLRAQLAEADAAAQRGQADPRWQRRRQLNAGTSTSWRFGNATAHSSSRNKA